MIVRVEHKTSYTVIDNTAINDDRLSFRAVGLLAYLLSRPDGWHVDYRSLSTTHSDGESSTRAALKELEEAGYLERRRGRGDDGRVRWEQIVHETSSTPCGGNHAAEIQAWKPAAVVSTEKQVLEQIPTRSATPKPEREKDLIFDAIIEVCGIPPREATNGTAARVGKTKREIVAFARDAGLPTDPAELAKGIRTRSRRYRVKMPGCELTPEALAKWWSTLGPSAGVESSGSLFEDLRRMSEVAQ
jgi:hypothetical protein